MPRCAAQTKKGHRCLKQALSGGDYCATHGDQVSSGSALAMLLGGIAGNAIAPGLGGVIAGAFAGSQLRRAVRESATVKRRVFVSFDFDYDRALKEFIVGQARLPDSPFDIVDHSLKEAAPERDWVNKARAAIRRAEIVLVIAGTQTYRARGVLQEIAMAREEGIPIVQIIGYKDRECPSVPNAGRVYAWTWDNLKNLLK
ncbi:MAG: TIR domain-containing protein [Pirellulaceae bacterium]